MEKKIAQLVEMGATTAQARAALTRYKDVDQAAEKFFEGQFDNVTEDDAPADALLKEEMSGSKFSIPEEDSDDDMLVDDEDDVEDFGIEGSDLEEDAIVHHAGIDPYAGIFFSKDRQEETIEVEELQGNAFIPSLGRSLPIMSQGEFMKGCPEGGEQGFLFQLYTKLTAGSSSCPTGCGWTFQRHNYDFFAIFPDFPSYIECLRTIIKQRCRICETEFCACCGESYSNRDATPGLRSDILFHCSDLQGVIIGMGLSMIDMTFDAQQSRHYASVVSGKSKRKSVELENDSDDNETPLPSGTKKRKSGKRAMGTGYAGNVHEDRSGQDKAQALQNTNDKLLAEQFQQVRVYLPSIRRDGGAYSTDYLVNPTTLAHLRRRFNRVCSVLLRNDSLVDMSERHVLYFELFEWLATISHHEALASLMAMPIMNEASRTIRRQTSSKGRSKEFDVIYQGSAGPRELLELISIQARAAMKGLETGVPEPAIENRPDLNSAATPLDNGKGKELCDSYDKNLQRLQNFCSRILSTRDAIDRALVDVKGPTFVNRLMETLPRIPDSQTGEDLVFTAVEDPEEVKKAYVEWATRVRFEYCDLSMPPEQSNDQENGKHGVMNWKHCYSREARALIQAELPRRSVSIAKELAVLTTNLPVAWDSSIFLQVDETRVDIIKALIIGPEGTPYQNGCYLFDIFLGASYNQNPPSVKYMTTNGGKYRFNPNLYADGKVCLSLLGTWSGPGWVAGKSTLLQVLVSIQSMILCPEPCLNEPGWEAHVGTQQSRQYSAGVRRMVVHSAMLGNLKNPPSPFEHIITTHFKFKKREILKQLDNWVQLDKEKGAGDDRLRSIHGDGPGSELFMDSVKELKQKLLAL